MTVIQTAQKRDERFVQAMIDGWPELRPHLGLEKDESGNTIIVVRNEDCLGSGAFFIIRCVQSLAAYDTVCLGKGSCLDPRVRAVFLFALAQWFGDER